MQCYKELLPPTGITHTVALPLTGSTARNVVAAKGSLLQVYKLIEVDTSSSPDNSRINGSILPSTDSNKQSRLVLLAEYPVAATVTSMAPVKLHHSLSGGDALLVSFKDAQMSLLQWDPENHRISTLSIHYYEKAEVLNTPHKSTVTYDYASKVIIDPTSRCAALCFGPRHVAILPFPDTSLNGTDDLIGDETVILDDGPSTTDRPTQDTASASKGSHQTPYAASFVMSLTSLDPTLTHPLNLAFLYEYRDPTFGILSSDRASSYAIRDQRKDILSYSVITFDVEQRTATTLLTIKGLPSTLTRLIPLPRPIGGALLIGPDELIHVDQSGKTTGVGVNQFARATSAAALHDQSDLNVRLDRCIVETLDAASGTLLIVLASGQLALLSFHIDGRSVSGLTFHLVPPQNGGSIGLPSPTSITMLNPSRLLIGSDQGNSVILGWSQTTEQPSRKRKRSEIEDKSPDPAANDDDSDIDFDNVDDGDDDLYGGGSTSTTNERALAARQVSDPDSCRFYRHQALRSYAPISSACFGAPVASVQSSSKSSLSLVAAVGRQSNSRLITLSRSLDPVTVASSDYPNTRRLWTVTPQQSSNAQSAKSMKAPHARYLVRYDLTPDAEEITALLACNDENSTLWDIVEDTDFENEGETVDMAVLGQGSKIIHIRKIDIRVYDTAFGLSQIYPIVDPVTEDELQVTHTSVCDPFVLTIQHDQSVNILRLDNDGELQEVERSQSLSSVKYRSGCLYSPADHSQHVPLLWLLDVEGGLTIYDVDDMTSPVYLTTSLSALPPVLSTESRQRRAAAREDLVELLVSDLGDEVHRSPYLILRTATNEITIYEMFHYSSQSQDPPAPRTAFTSNLRFRKIPGLHLPKAPRDDHEGPLMCPIANVGGFSVVSVSGSNPAFIIKESTGLPRIVELGPGYVRSICGLDTSSCNAGFGMIDDSGSFRQCQLPSETTYSHQGWIIRELGISITGHEIHQIAYHATTRRYIIVTSEQVDYEPSEEEQKQAVYDESLKLRPQIGQYSVRLLAPETGAITDIYELRPHEMVTSLVCAPIELSELSHERQELVSIGTMMQYGESNASKGAVHVLELIDVVPDPDLAGTGKGFRLLNIEETKTGVTAMMGIDGVLGTAQVLKLMFRGLKDETLQLLPVAFLDAPCYTTVLKALDATNLWLAGDVKKGLWLGGFSEDPYRISLFGQSRPNLSVMAAEFLPQGEQLFLLVADADQNLHVLQFDPENPLSMSGRRLLHRSSFHIGHEVTNMLLVPCSSGPSSAGEDGTQLSNQRQVLITTASGMIALVTPLQETQYRRLAALQTSSLYMLEHLGGLNPRSYRTVDTSTSGGGSGAGAGSGVMKSTIDGEVVGRISEFGAGKRSEILGRSGVEGGRFVSGFGGEDFGLAVGKGLKWF